MRNDSSVAVTDDRRRTQVRERYGRIASTAGTSATPSAAESDCCGQGAGSTCCGDTSVAIQLGYTPEQLEGLPKGADLGLGCGNPTTILRLKAGQTVLDLGSGAGIDCFLAAQKVGAKGSVIGVDMTPGMLGKARDNARNGGYKNVDFRLGEIEHLPVRDASVDVIISNCVINLAPDKEPVYREAFRVLRPGGELAVSDVVATRPISARDRADPSLWSSCSSGALEVSKVKSLLRRAGFVAVSVKLRIPERTPGSLDGQARIGVVPADIRATKPGA
ncbi:MAG: arsenite methyltransferase [Thermoplasmata archaeon]